MESKGHNRPARIVEHEKSKNAKKGAAEGDQNQVNPEEKGEERDDTGSKVRLDNDASRTLDDDVQPEQQADGDSSGEQPKPTQKDITETTDTGDKEDRDEEKDRKVNQQEFSDHDKDDATTADKTGNGMPSISTTPEPTDPEDFDSRSFLQSVRDLHARLKSATSRTDTDEPFPADELKHLVHDASTTLNNFKNYTEHSQSEMEDLRHEMEDVGLRIARQVQRRAYTPDTKAGRQTENVEERQLEAKLAELNADLARAGEELARASRVTVETEQAAVEASLAAEAATEAAATMQDEYERRREAEVKVKVAEEERNAAEEQKREAEQRRADEERAAAEKKAARLRRQESSQTATPWYKWPFFTYKVPPGPTDQGIGCVVRGDPVVFKDNMLECSVLPQQTTTFTYGDNEQLISNIVRISATDPEYTLEKPIYVSIPYHAARAFTVREAVIKAETAEGEWTVLDSSEVTFDNLNIKDVKFVQAEVTQFTDLAVVTRFKRDFLHFTKRTRKVISLLDGRITFTVERDTFDETEQFTLQIQPVETSAVNDLKNAEPTCTGLLACSAIVTMEWASGTFAAPVTMTLPCPANPVKVKKAAAARAAKEAKMKTTERLTMAEIQKMNQSTPKKKAPAKQTKVVIETGDEEDEEESRRTRGPTKWYMGQYGNNDEDEDDVLYFLQQLHNNRWSVMPDVDIQQTKLDLLQFELVKPIESFMVLRTKTTVTDSEAEIMAKAIEKQLGLKLVTVILKQRSEDLSDVTLHVIHPSRADRLIRQLEASGYDDGPDISAPHLLREGEVLEVGFRGNVRSYDDSQQLEMVYNSPLSTSVTFDVVEVDKFLQRSYTTYKGFVQLIRKVKVVRQRSVKDDAGEVHQEAVVEYLRNVLCDILISVSKSSELSTPPPVKAPVTILNRDDGISMDTLRQLALELGDEWRKLAHQLNVRRVRVQAILRNTTMSERGIDDAKYEMLLTWMKAAPRGMNKVQTLKHALMRSGRLDLAQEIVDQFENYCNRKKANDL